MHCTHHSIIVNFLFCNSTVSLVWQLIWFIFNSCNLVTLLCIPVLLIYLQLLHPDFCRSTKTKEDATAKIPLNLKSSDVFAHRRIFCAEFIIELSFQIPFCCLLLLLMGCYWRKSMIYIYHKWKTIKQKLITIHTWKIFGSQTRSK